MKNKIHFENLKSAIGIAAIVGGVSLLAVWTVNWYENRPAPTYVYETTKYGAFLAGQHAIYVNDFAAASKFAAELKDVDAPLVKTTNVLTDFLAGKIDDTAADLKSETKIPLRVIYMTHLLANDDWRGVYDLYKNNDSSVLSALRIWSSVAIGRDADALKFVDTLKNTNESWQHWTRGMIYAETNKPARAKESFEKVSLDFLNLNDYLYLIAFYNHNGFDDAARDLHDEFTARPAGLYMLNQSPDYKWDEYSGLKNALSFSLIQAVSHSASMSRSDLALLLLRMAENTAAGQADAINYYLGMYFYANDGDYQVYFDRITKQSLFYPFVMLKYAEKTEKFRTKRRELEAAIKQNPLFVPAVAKLTALNVQNNDERGALRVLDNALSQPNLSDIGRAFFLKNRAHVYLVFGNPSDAQRDIDEAAVILPADAGVLSEQARIWAAAGKNLDDAYAYALALVKRFPGEIEVWDTLGRAVLAKDGPDVALTIYEKVGRVAESCSSLFENLGDIYAEMGDAENARAAYTRAISLSEDGMTIEKTLRKKIKALK